MICDLLWLSAKCCWSWCALVFCPLSPQMSEEIRSLWKATTPRGFPQGVRYWNSSKQAEGNWEYLLSHAFTLCAVKHRNWSKRWHPQYLELMGRTDIQKFHLKIGFLEAESRTKCRAGSLWSAMAEHAVTTAFVAEDFAGERMDSALSRSKLYTRTECDGR